MSMFVFLFFCSGRTVERRIEDDHSTIKYLSEIAVEDTPIPFGAAFSREVSPLPYLAILFPFVASIFYGSEATDSGWSLGFCALSRSQTANSSVYLAEAEAADTAKFVAFPPYLSGQHFKPISKQALFHQLHGLVLRVYMQVHRDAKLFSS
jgi:hypothetical protein